MNHFFVELTHLPWAHTPPLRTRACVAGRVPDRHRHNPCGSSLPCHSLACTCFRELVVSVWKRSSARYRSEACGEVAVQRRALLGLPVQRRVPLLGRAPVPERASVPAVSRSRAAPPPSINQASRPQPALISPTQQLQPATLIHQHQFHNAFLCHSLHPTVACRNEGEWDGIAGQWRGVGSGRLRKLGFDRPPGPPMGRSPSWGSRLLGR